MTPKDRFERLEGDQPPQALPPKVAEAVENLRRFQNLEIGELKAPAPSAAPAPAPVTQRVLCRHCSQPNEPQRDTCWACFKKLAAEAPKPAPPKGEAFTLVLDGKTYKADDADLPDDIRELMDRIAKRGYSEQLLVEWREWRVTRNAAKLRAAEADRDVKVFKGQRVSVIRLDDKVYTSDDPYLTPEFKELFAYIDRHGVTPALMEHLRGKGESVKFRPGTTALPSDGDVAFWKNVQPQVEDSVMRRHDEMELEAARRRHEDQRARVFAQLAPFAIIVGAYALALLFKGC